MTVVSRITDADDNSVYVEVHRGMVCIDTDNDADVAGVRLTVDQCAALIAAITDAAKVVTGEKA